MKERKSIWLAVIVLAALGMAMAGCINPIFNINVQRAENSGNTTPVLISEGTGGFLGDDEEVPPTKQTKGKKAGFSQTITNTTTDGGTDILSETPLPENSEPESGDSSEDEQPEACLEPGTDLRELAPTSPPTSRPVGSGKLFGGD